MNYLPTSFCHSVTLLTFLTWQVKLKKSSIHNQHSKGPTKLTSCELYWMSWRVLCSRANYSTSPRNKTEMYLNKKRQVLKRTPCDNSRFKHLNKQKGIYAKKRNASGLTDEITVTTKRCVFSQRAQWRNHKFCPLCSSVLRFVEVRTLQGIHPLLRPRSFLRFQFRMTCSFAMSKPEVSFNFTLSSVFSYKTIP